MNFLQRVGFSVKAFTMRWGKPTYGWTWGNSRARRQQQMQIGQGLEASVVVAPLAWLQRNFPQAPLRVQKKNKDGSLDEIVESETGPGALLARWNEPNEYYTGKVMQKALIADYKTTGNAFVLKLRNGSGRWIESWWAPSWSMRPHWPDDGSEYLDYWVYNIDGIEQHVSPDDVIHFRDGINPYNSRLGFCAFAALLREVYTDEEASRFTSALLSNLGVPGVVIAPSAASTAAAGPRGAIFDTEKVKTAFKETFGGDNRGDAMVLSGSTDVHVLSFNPQQLTLRDLRKIPEERVSGTLGVPAIVAGLGAGLDRSTFANFAEAREAGYEEGLIPAQDDFASTLKQQGLSEFVPVTAGFVVDFDLSEVRVLQEDQNKLWERALSALNKGGISRRRFKEMVGETPEDNDLDEVYYIPVNLVVTPVQEDQTVVDTTPPAAPPEPNPLDLPQAPATAPAASNGNGSGNGSGGTLASILGG